MPCFPLPVLQFWLPLFPASQHAIAPDTLARPPAEPTTAIIPNFGSLGPEQAHHVCTAAMASNLSGHVQTELPSADLMERNSKRRRLSLRSQQQSSTMSIGLSTERPSSASCQHGHDNKTARQNAEKEEGERKQGGKEGEIALPAFNKHANQTVTPFLANHIPSQYAPHGLGTPPTPSSGNSNTKYCYRHRPDLKCRRQADEPSMEQLQNELATLSQSDQQGIAHVWSLFSAAPAKHRHLMLQGILAQCCFPQLSLISASIRNLIKIDFLSALPSELAFQILSYLDTASLCKAAQVSQRWRSLADDDVVWHRMCEQHIDRKCTRCGLGLPLLDRKRLRTEKRQIQLRALGRGINNWSPEITPATEVPPMLDGPMSPDPSVPSSPEMALSVRKRVNGLSTSPDVLVKRVCMQSVRGSPDESYFQPRQRPWKDVYKDRFQIHRNWKTGRYSIKMFKGHTNGVMCLQFDDNILATGSYDATIKIWDIETGRELRTLRGHESGIRCLQFDDTKLISGSIDRTLRIWNWRTGECLFSKAGHSGAIISVHFDPSMPNIVASGSTDTTITIWNFQDRTSFKLRGHGDWVNAVKIDAASRTLLSASDDCTVRLWDLDSRTCIKIFEGHVGQVQQVLWLPQDFEMEDGVNADPDRASSPAPGTISATDFYPNCRDPNRPLPPRYMVTGALDSTIRLWDVHAPSIVPTTSPTITAQHTPSSSTSSASIPPGALPSQTASTSLPPPPPPVPSQTPTPAIAPPCIRTLFGHLEGVWALAADQLRLVSGAEDRMVKVWDARTGKCERTFTGHKGPVTCVWLGERRLGSGGEDGEVRLYEF